MTALADIDREEILREVRGEEEFVSTYKINSRDITSFSFINGSLNIVVRQDDKYEFTDLGLRQFLKMFKIPYNYFINASLELRKKILDEGLNTNKTFKIRVKKVIDDTIKSETHYIIYSCLACAYPDFKISDLLSFVLRILPEDYTIYYSEMDNECCTLKVASTIKLKEDYLLGFNINFSDVGTPYEIKCSAISQDNIKLLLFDTKDSPKFRMSLARWDEGKFNAEVGNFFLGNFNTSSLVKRINYLEKLKSCEVILSESTNSYDFAVALNKIVPSPQFRATYKETLFSRFLAMEDNSFYGLILSLYSLYNSIDGDEEGNPNNLDNVLYCENLLPNVELVLLGEKIESSVAKFLTKIYDSYVISDTTPPELNRKFLVENL